MFCQGWGGQTFSWHSHCLRTSSCNRPCMHMRGEPVTKGNVARCLTVRSDKRGAEGTRASWRLTSIVRAAARRGGVGTCHGQWACRCYGCRDCLGHDRFSSRRLHPMSNLHRALVSLLLLIASDSLVSLHAAPSCVSCFPAATRLSAEPGLLCWMHP